MIQLSKVYLVATTAIILCGFFPARASGQVKHVVVISIDGLMPAAYTKPVENGKHVPNLLAMKQEGCASPGVLGVFPTVTYPSHTAMMTGQFPAAHGIVGNNPLDPFDRTNAGWFWYADKIQVPTLWDVIKQNKGTVGAISWPVTVGAAPIDYNIPEYRTIKIQDDISLLRGLSTPGLLANVEEHVGKLTPEAWNDEWRANAASFIFKKYKPTLLLLHIFDLDHEQHAYGPGSPEALETLAKLDSYVGKLKKEIAEAAAGEPVAWIIVSDHGFRPIQKQFHPRVLLRSLGLASFNSQRKVTDWRVFTQNAGGSIAFFASDPKDQEAIRMTTAQMNALASDPQFGIGKLYTEADIKELKAFPGAFLAAEGAPGFAFGDGVDGPMVTRSASKGTHGYDPRHPELFASMILSGKGIQHCQELKEARLVDVAPTAAALLGMKFPASEGRPLN